MADTHGSDSELGIAEEEQAVMEWLNSFELAEEVTSMSDLCDGKVVANILIAIDSMHFSIDGVGAVSTSNIKKIIKMIQSYYDTVLGKDVDMSTIDITAITRKCDHDEIISLLEMVVGCAISCENKAQFIQTLLSLKPSSQSFLQGMVQRAMQRAVPKDDAGEGEDDQVGGSEGDLGTTGSHNDNSSSLSAGPEESKATSEELIRSREMNKHLQEERNKLMQDLAQAEKVNIDLRSQLQNLNEKISVYAAEQESLEGADKNRANAAANLTSQLQIELDEAKRELDLKIVELEGKQDELNAQSRNIEKLSANQARMNMEMQQMTDELDLARDTSRRLSQAEASIEKYQRRIEELNAFKKQNKELELKMEEYLDKIHDLESGNKSIATLTKKIEQYKNENVILDREKIETLSALSEQQRQNEILTSDLKKANDTKRLLENDLDRVKMELELAVERDAEKESEKAEAGGLGSVELIEKVKRLEIELRAAKDAGGNSEKSTVDDSIRSTASADEQMNELLKEELEHTKQKKKDTEEQLMTSRRENVELKSQVNNLSKELKDMKENRADHDASIATTKDLEVQLAQKTNTVKALEEKLQEKESIVNRLEQDKNKLENYSKQALSTFKDKYIQALQKLKSDKKYLEENVLYLKGKNEKDQETHRREERLMISSVYELGLKMMDSRIRAKAGENSSGDDL